MPAVRFSRALPPLVVALAVAALVAGPLPGQRAAAKDASIARSALGNADRAFSARVIVKADGQMLRGRVWHRPGMQRQEFDRSRSVRIIRFDRNLVLTLDPERRTVHRAPLDRVAAAAGVLWRDELVLRPIGRESLAEGPAEVLSVDARTADGARLSGTVWLGPQGIVLRKDLIVRRFKQTYQLRFELAELRSGAQPRRLFEVPRGYRQARAMPDWSPPQRRKAAAPVRDSRQDAAKTATGVPKRHSLYEIFKER